MELPLTGLEALEDVVGLPDLNDSFLNTDYLDNTDYLENQESHFQEHFASQIALRRLSVQFHNMLRNGESSGPSPILIYYTCIYITPHLGDMQALCFQGPPRAVRL